MSGRSAGAALVASIAAGVAAAPAAAQEPAPAPAPVAGKLALQADRTARDGKRAVVLSGGRYRVRGTVTPWVAGQKVTIRVTRGSKRLASRTLAVKEVRGKGRGSFVTTFRAPSSGRVAVRAVHRATPELATLRSKAARIVVVRPRASAGARGPAVRLLQAGLDRMGYAVSRSGTYDAATGRAVTAYRKVNGMERTSAASSDLIRRVVAGRGAFKPARPDGGRHLEADLSRQVLALVDGKRVVRVYTTSSGAPSTPTVLGAYRVYRKEPGTNSLGMVHSSYFVGGYAVHGYKSVPNHNASHGCLRVPIPDARAIYDWLKPGTRVFVYR